MDRKYYAVERSGNSLAHYGVKGMKWGVRKRSVSISTVGRPRSTGYKKAAKKLGLFDSSAREINKVQNAQLANKTRKVSRMYKKAEKKLEKLKQDANLDFQRGQYEQMKEDQSRMFWWSDNSKGLSGLGLRGNKAVRIMNRLDGRKSKKLATAKGHAKAVRKRNEYEKHMAKMFAGTEYANKTKSVVAKRRRESRNV